METRLSFFRREVSWKIILGLCTVYAGLQFGDLISTKIGLTLYGAHELNPFGFHPILKLAGTILVFSLTMGVYFTVEKRKHYWAHWVILALLIGLDMASVVVVANNFMVIERLSSAVNACAVSYRF